MKKFRVLATVILAPVINGVYLTVDASAISQADRNYENTKENEENYGCSGENSNEIGGGPTVLQSVSQEINIDYVTNTYVRICTLTFTYSSRCCN